MVVVVVVVLVVLVVIVITSNSSLLTGGLSNVLSLNSNTILPSPVATKLVLALYLVPPTVVGTVLVYNGPCDSGLALPAPLTRT